jgi:hypothetical protein
VVTLIQHESVETLDEFLERSAALLRVLDWSKVGQLQLKDVRNDVEDMVRKTLHLHAPALPVIDVAPHGTGKT